MPNWCENNLFISGSVEAMDKWRIALVNDYSLVPLLKFNSLLPLPKEEENNWYDWRVTNWGTKWDLAEEHAGVEPYEQDLEQYGYDFDTAWSPPDALFKNISGNFPGITFLLRYVEPGNCFAGSIEILDGKVIDETVYQTEREVGAFAHENFGYDPYELDLEDDSWSLSEAIDNKEEEN